MLNEQQHTTTTTTTTTTTFPNTNNNNSSGNKSNSSSSTMNSNSRRRRRDWRKGRSKWVKFDDSRTQSFDEKMLEKECFGEGHPGVENNTNDAFQWGGTGVSWEDQQQQQQQNVFGMLDPPAAKVPTAYMLVYERDVPLTDVELARQVRSMKKKKSGKQQPDPASQASSARNQKSSGIDAKKSASLKKTSEDIVAGGGEKEEKEDEDDDSLLCGGVPSSVFNTPLSSYIPKGIASTIERDNWSLFADMQLFDPEYYLFSSRIFSLLKGGGDSKQQSAVDRKTYISFVASNFSFMLNVIARSSHKTVFAPMASQLLSLLKHDPELCEEAVLKPLASNPRLVVDFALMCRERSVQKNFLTIVGRAMVVSAKKELRRVEAEAMRAVEKDVTNTSVKDAPTCVKMLHVLVALFKDVRSNWVRMREFFAMLLGLVTEVPVLKYLLITSPFSQAKVLPDLISLCTHEFPKVASRAHETQTRLLRLLPLLASLIQCCTTPADEEYMMMMMPASTSSSAAAGGAGSGGGKIIPQVRFRRAGLREDLLCSQDLIMCYKHDSKAISDILCHWAYENKSYQIIDQLVDAVDRSTSRSLPALFAVIQDLLCIEDTYQNMRINSFIGSDGDGIMHVIGKNAANKGYIATIVRHVILMGIEINELGRAMIQDSCFSTSMIQWLKYNLENAELIGYYERLAQRHGADLAKMAQAAQVWNCRACTFENVPVDASCSMCGQPRFIEGQEVQAWHEGLRDWLDAIVVERNIIKPNFYDIRWRSDASGSVKNEILVHYRNLREKKMNTAMTSTTQSQHFLEEDSQLHYQQRRRREDLLHEADTESDNDTNEAEGGGDNSPSQLH